MHGARQSDIERRVERDGAAEVGNLIINEHRECSGIAGAKSRDISNRSQERRPRARCGRLLFGVNGLRDDLTARVDDGIDLHKGVRREVRKARHAIPFKHRAAVGQDRQGLPGPVMQSESEAASESDGKIAGAHALHYSVECIGLPGRGSRRGGRDRDLWVNRAGNLPGIIGL